MCKPSELKTVTAAVENTTSEEVDIMTTIDGYDVSEYLMHAENINQGNANVEGHAYHSNGNTVVVSNDESTQS